MPEEALPIHRLAHDLRQSLRAMVQAARKLETSGAHVEPILEAARRQDELLAAAVEYEAAGEDADGRLMPLTVAIHSACERVEALRQARLGEIHLPAVKVDAQAPAALAKVLEKVLHNALRFHRPGVAPVVSMDLTIEAEWVTIRVSDQGLGIAEAYREKIFAPFQKLNSSTDYPGAGLGLATARRLVNALGGSIVVEEHNDDGGRDVGATFAIRFPVF